MPHLSYTCKVCKIVIHVCAQATYFAIQRSLEELHEKLFPLFERDWSVQDTMWQAANTQLCDTAQLGIPIKHTEWCRSGTTEWGLVVAELKEAVRSKRAGLDLLWMLKQAVINLTACAPENTVLGADDLLPLMECAVLDAKLTGFPSLVEYASRMLPKELELGEMGYLAVVRPVAVFAESSGVEMRWWVAAWTNDFECCASSHSSDP